MHPTTAVRPARSLGDGIVGRVHSTLGQVRAAAGLGLRLTRLRGLPALSVGPIGRATATDHATEPPVALRIAGEDHARPPADLADAFPYATGRLAVFLPEPGESERAWGRAADRVGDSYPGRLGSLLDWTPVHLRVAEDVPVAEAGVAVSGLVQALVAAWPVDVRRIALVGQAGGGLVLRAACGVWSPADQPWTDLVSDVVVLGTPHLVGDPGRLPTTVVGRGLDQRLAGITSSAEAAADLPPLPHARYAVVSDRHTVNPHPVGRFLGDLLWWRQTVTGRRRPARHLFPTAEMCEVSTLEFPLANHPGVHQLLLDRLA